MGCSSSTRPAERRGEGRATQGEGGERQRVRQDRPAEVGQHGVGIRRPHVPTPYRPCAATSPLLPTVRFSRFGFFPLHLPPSFPFSVLALLAVAIIFPFRFHARHWLWIRLGLEAAVGQTITRTTDEADLFILSTFFSQEKSGQKENCEEL